MLTADVFGRLLKGAGAVERKDCALSFKAEGTRIEGYGATFGDVDQGGDRIAPGAFAKSLGRRRVRMFWNHDPARVVGVWDEVTEDEKGLRVRGRFADTPAGREVRQLVEMGAVDSMSIGYRVGKSGRDGNVRVLEEIDLFEVSLVAIPMNENARVDAAKALAEGRVEFVRRVFEQTGLDAGLPAEMAAAAAAAAVKSLTPNRQGIDEVLAALRARAGL